MRHGSQIDPPNRFETVHRVADLEQVEWDDEYLHGRTNRKIEYLADDSKSIVAENDSPDLNFRYSVNPYRGCAHGCAYCYARPYHEYLGLNAGLDFETKIFVKHNAPNLLREFLARDAWRPEVIAFSGVTDCYQPAERDFRLTRDCLEVAAEANQPIGIVTKNALVVRDADILGPMAEQNQAVVNISLTTLDPELARAMEPRTSIPTARLRAIRELTQAGVPVRVMAAPIIPGLNDSELPSLLEAAAGAGAVSASYILVRLPLTVEPVFREWLERTQPTKRNRIEGLIRQTRDGELNDSNFGNRMRGAGNIAGQIRSIFQVFAKKHGLSRRLPPLDFSRFRPPLAKSGQMRLF